MQQPFWTQPPVALLGGTMASSGVPVSQTSALTSSAYYSGVSFRARTVAQVPLIVYERLEPRGKQRAADHQLYELLHDSPNPEMTAFDFKEALEGHVWTWGNAYAEIEWDPRKQVPTALWPLRPDMMHVSRDDKTKAIVYRYTLPGGGSVELPASKILHLHGFGFDGLVGYDPITLHREAIGLGKAMEKFGATFFGNGSSLSGVLTHPNRLSDTARKNMKESWDKAHTGLSNQHRITILEEGVSWAQIGIPPENAQFLESRKFQVREMARILHLPPHIIADLDQATFSNIEQQSLELVMYHLMPDFIRWEQAAKLRLLPGAENKKYFTEFLVVGLLRGDTATRYKAYAVGRQWGWLSANDIRELENMNPLPDDQGDIYMVPLNMTTPNAADQLDNEPQKQGG